MESYENMLNEAYEKIKPISHGGERFEIPKIEGHHEGTKTILSNLPQITSYIRRDPNHFLRYILKQLATPGTMKNSIVVMQRKIPSPAINDKIIDYVKEFVICKECGKPDTELIKDKGYSFMHCLACGAKHPIRTKF